MSSHVPHRREPISLLVALRSFFSPQGGSVVCQADDLALVIDAASVADRVGEGTGREGEERGGGGVGALPEDGCRNWVWHPEERAVLQDVADDLAFVVDFMGAAAAGAERARGERRKGEDRWGGGVRARPEGW